jgi:hypothetical protein
MALSHRDDAARIVSGRPDDDDDLNPKSAHGDPTGLPIVLPVVFHLKVPTDENLRCVFKIQASVFQHVRTFLRIVCDAQIASSASQRE